MARSDWQYLTGSTNNNNVFFTGIRWRYRDDLFGTSGYPADRVSSNTDIIEYQPYVGKKSNYTSMYYSNWLTSYYKYSYNTISGSDPESASNQLNISTTFRFDKASTNTNYYLTKGNLSSGNVMNTNSSTTSRIIQVPHCSDGTSKLRLYFYFKGNSDTYFHYAETNQIVTLETIPRASSFTLSKTSGGDEASSFNLRESIYVNITRASDTFTHRVYFVVGSSGNQLLSSSAATSANGTLSIDLANYILTPSSIATMYVDTYNGSTLIGSSSKTFTLVVPDDVKPTISSVTTSDTQDRLSVFGAYVQGKSTLRIQTSANGIYGSSIQSCTVQIKNGNTVLQTLSGTDVSLTNISYTGNLTVSVTVTDSRGRTSSTTTKSITVLEYFNPQINTFQAVRDNNTPTNVTVSINSDIAPLNNNNTKSWILRYKPTSSYSWIEQNLTSSGYTLNTTVSLTNIDDNVGYDFQLVATDYFAPDSTNTRNFDLGTSFDLINYKSDGSAIAFGKVSEESDTFEIALKTILYERIFSTMESTGVSSRSRIRFIGNANYNYLPDATTDTDICSKALLKWICSTYPNDTATTYIFTYTPNAQGLCIVHIYNNSDTDSNGYPRYATGHYFGYGGSIITFGTTDFSWHFSAKVIRNIAEINGSNQFVGRQSISANGRTMSLGPENVTFTHYETNADSGHWFNKNVYVQGNVYAGSSYNRQLAYQDEVGSTTGTSGIWNYIKFNNGFAICWGTYVFSSTINNSWGGLYNGSAVEPPDFPFTFTEIPTVTMTPTNSEAENTSYMWILGNYGGSGGKPSTTNPGKFNPSRGSSVSSSQKYAVAITAFGKWK